MIHAASPFVRVTTREDLDTAPNTRPGWMLGTLDAPVISFGPYIWRHGERFVKIAEFMTKGGRYVNVLPHTIARYARLLHSQKLIPEQSCS